ncbi:HepT-like ribonuclease domain-containing protein [Ferroglobus sp.]|uniref:type VII toxin-antitoxin system HepT family RNase toxin n=1 Tax=Ferroglobus sp. TaxID=2614230 RepID=UPI0025C57F45|nr:HepT-like ribonuclease domain-containing protein [Ferroglobus sp.]
MRLVEHILRFERHLEGAKKLKSKDVRDYFVYNTLAMECFQAVNTLIDIAQYIVMKKRLGFPSTYRELFEILEEAGYISGEELKTFKRLVFLRNLIAHEYYRISENELLEMVNLLEKCSDFVNRVKVEVGKL